MAEFIDRAGPYTPRLPQGDPFRALVRAIVFQQLAGRAAAAIHARVLAAVGGEMTPAAVLATPVDVLCRAGLSAAKAASLVDLATKSADGTLALDRLAELDDEEIVARLVAVRGIGRWTAQMFLLFELQRPDVWPIDDLGVRAGYGVIYRLPDVIRARDLAGAGERFRPYRSLVALYCWHALHLARGTQPITG